MATVAATGMLRALRLGSRLLYRDARAGELTLLVLALMLAVASMTSVGFLADRIQQALHLEARQLLGGDLLLTADRPFADTRLKEAQRHGLQSATSLTFPSMVRPLPLTPDSSSPPSLPSSSRPTAQLADIKAVSPGYPLRGALQITRGSEPPQDTRALPEPGSVWIDEPLSQALDLRPGDHLQLGRRTFKVDALLMREPDRGIGMFGLAPRLLINQEDVASTGLLHPASRVSWRLHLAGSPTALAAYQTWLQPQLTRGERLENLDNARPEIRTLLERAQRFLRLAALLSVILAAVVVGMAARRHAQRHLDGCAVMRCLGARQSQLLLIHGSEFLLAGLLAILAGGLLGYLLQWVMPRLLTGLLSVPLPAPTLRPWGQGLLIGLVLLLGFALPPLLRLRAVSTLRVLRREWQDAPSAGRIHAALTYLLGLSSLLLLMLWVADELLLGLLIGLGFLLALAVYALLAWLLLRALPRPRRSAARWPGLRLAVASLQRHPGASLLQITALAIGLTALLLLTLGRQDLLGHWQAQLPADAPNRFIINIQPEQHQGVRDFFIARGLPAPTLQPMIRARLMAINDTPITAQHYTDERAQHLADREFNLSWASELPPGNQISAGQWHGHGQTPQPTGETEFSVEQGLARTLALKLGDRLTYDIAGSPLSGRITSLRQLDWGSLRVNFFVLTPPAALESFPRSEITSIHLPAGQAGFSAALIRNFPNLTLIDVSAVMRQLQDMLGQISHAIELIFGLAVLCSLLVLLATLQAGQDQRQREWALLRALGARNRQMRAALLSEFALLGSSAGLLAGLGATAITAALAHFALQLDYLPTPRMLLAGLAAGLLCTLLAGGLGSLPLTRRPPLSLLRDAAA